jgi:hypothetical protein
MSKSARARSSKPRAGFKARSKVGRKAAGHHHRRVDSKQARVLTLLRRPSGGVRRSQGAAMHPAPPPPGHSGRPACYPTNGTLFLQGAANRSCKGLPTAPIAGCAPMNHWGDGLSRVRWTLALAAPPPHLGRGGGIIMTATMASRSPAPLAPALPGSMRLQPCSTPRSSSPAPLRRSDL